MRFLKLSGSVMGGFLATISGSILVEEVCEGSVVSLLVF